MTLAPGDLLIDFSGLRLDEAKVAAFVKANGKGFIRYSAGAASDPGNPNHSAVAWKLISPAEFKFLTQHGDVIANDEWFESRVTQGWSAGHADGLAAARLWKQCGLGRGATIYVSWDQFPAKASWVKVGRYVRGYRKALAGYYNIDAYAGTGFLRWAIKNKFIRFGWRPNAGSWSVDGLPYQPDTSTPAKRAALVKLARSKSPAHLWQTGNYWFDKNADEDLVVRVPVGSHFEALAGTSRASRIRQLKGRIAALVKQLASLRAQLKKLNG